MRTTLILIIILTFSLLPACTVEPSADVTAQTSPDVTSQPAPIPQPSAQKPYIPGTDGEQPPTMLPSPETENPIISDAAYVSRKVRPGETDAAIRDWNEPHYVGVPVSDNQRRGKLWVFLPGTGATPDYYTMLTQEAAKAGLHSVCLRYPNDESVNIQICPEDSDSDCHEKVREEIINGVDVSEHVKADSANSITGRLKSLLLYLRSEFPDEGWGQYLDSDNEVVWSSVVIASPPGHGNTVTG